MEYKFAEACFPSIPRFDRRGIVRTGANLVKLSTPRLISFEATFICLGSMYNRAVVNSKNIHSGEDSIVYRLAMAERNEQNDIQALNRTIPIASSATGKPALVTFGLTLP